MKDIAIEYLGGSGFLVSLGDTGLLFDASETGPDKRSLPGKETLAAFARRSTICAAKRRRTFWALTFPNRIAACAWPPATSAVSAR